MSIIHHPGLKREADVPEKTVHIWQLSGWEPGPLPAKPSRKIVNPRVVEHPAPESGDSTTPRKED
jgi:hypothetical protein